MERQRPNRRFPSDVRFDSTLTTGRARLLKYFGNASIQPYAGGSIGVTRVNSTYDYPLGCPGGPNQPSCPTRDIRRITSTNGTFGGFVGVRIPTGVLFVRPEFEVSFAGEHMRIGANVGVGVLW